MGFIFSNSYAQNKRDDSLTIAHFLTDEAFLSDWKDMKHNALESELHYLKSKKNQTAIDSLNIIFLGNKTSKSIQQKIFHEFIKFILTSELQTTRFKELYLFEREELYSNYPYNNYLIIRSCNNDFRVYVYKLKNNWKLSTELICSKEIKVWIERYINSAKNRPQFTTHSPIFLTKITKETIDVFINVYIDDELFDFFHSLRATKPQYLPDCCKFKKN